MARLPKDLGPVHRKAKCVSHAYGCVFLVLGEASFSHASGCVPLLGEARFSWLP